MASKNPDIWLWAGLAILGYYAAMTVHIQLVSIRKASEVTPREDTPDVLSQRTENALKLDTLGQLAENANQDIKAASVKILSERSLQDGVTWRMMLQDIDSSNVERRNRALACARFVLPYSRNNEKTDKMIHSIRTHKAIINCLFDMLPEASLAESDLPNDAGYRSQPERDAMWILQNILPFHPREAREAGIIRQWLVHYPFGGPTASLPLKRQVMSDIINSVQVYEDGDFGYAMQNILDRVLKIDEFREELIKYELIDTSQPVDAPLDYIPEGAVRTHRGWQTRNRDPRYYNPSEGDDWLADVPVGVVRTDEDRYRDTGGRRREESMEEQALRRRRRMAMVLGENGRPIQSGDIIQRDPVVLDEEVEEELEQLIEEVSAQEGTADTGWWGLLRRLVPGGVAPLPSMGDT